MANTLKISDRYEASSSNVAPSLALSLAERFRDHASLIIEPCHSYTLTFRSFSDESSLVFKPNGTPSTRSLKNLKQLRTRTASSWNQYMRRYYGFSSMFSTQRIALSSHTKL